jgi:hypothetical protein
MAAPTTREARPRPPSQSPGPPRRRSHSSSSQIERQQEIDLLGRSAQHREQDERELEQAEQQQPRHREHEQRRGHRCRHVVGRNHRSVSHEGTANRPLRVEPRTHRLAQRLALGLADIGKLQLVLAARAGLEAHLHQAEQARYRALLKTYVLDALERHRARLAADDPLLEADVAGADAIARATPAEPGAKRHHGEEHEPDQQAGGDAGGDIAASIDRRRQRQDELAQPAKRGGDDAERVQPPPGFLRFIAVRRRCGLSGERLRAHIVSRRTCARIASRISSAVSCARPGSATLALCVPAVCSVSVARP